LANSTIDPDSGALIPIFFAPFLFLVPILKEIVLKV